MKTKLIIFMAVSIFSLGIYASLSIDNTRNWNNPSDNTKSKHNTTSNKVFKLANQPITPEDIASLRGVHSLRELSIAPKENKLIKNGDYDRNFDLQPPLVPHKSAYMKITLTKNRCLNCHSNANYREQEADKMSGSHFMTRNGKRLKTLSPRRYFCKQCHVSQVDAKPLIQNTYINTDE